jgi:hypothetical protein
LGNLKVNASKMAEKEKNAFYKEILELTFATVKGSA